MAMATRWWHRREEQIVCTLCPRECALRDGQRGFCFVRQNVADEMVLTTYGRSSGFCIDPIEKKPLNHFLPGTPVLSFGTAGCNLGCKFCQNWSISKAREYDDRTDFASPEGIAQAALRHGCRSVAFTYNDPVIWAEYAIDTARACRELGIKTVAVTAGYISPEARGDFYSVMDAANVDLKAFTSEFYQHVTLSKIEPVLETLRWLKQETDVWFEITNLMIPGENDSADETAKMCDWIVENLGTDVPIHFTAFHPDFRMQDRPKTPIETLLRARQQALAAGIRYPYVGNVHDVAGQSTYCHSCGTLLIQRDWYVLGRYTLTGNRCRSCGVTIPGVFEQAPGTWGAKRQPIRISQRTEPSGGGAQGSRHLPPVLNPSTQTEVTPKFSSERKSTAISSPTIEASGPIMSSTNSVSSPAASSNNTPSNNSQTSTAATLGKVPDRSFAEPQSPLAWLSSVITVSSAAPVPAAMAKVAAVQAAPTVSAQKSVPAAPTTSPQTAGIGQSDLRIDFTEAESVVIASHARMVAEAATLGRIAPPLSRPLADVPAYGMFVSLKQGETLRGCKGQFGKIVPLGELVNYVAKDSATNDPRFPPVRPEEMSQLMVEVSLMYNPQPVALFGDDRIRGIRVGQHGLVIAHPKGRGLLLPQVATERRWSSLEFLEAVCRKAGLPSDTWKSPEAQLMTFEARLFHSPPSRTSTSLFRPAARAGQFYPAEPREMHAEIQRHLGAGKDAAAAETRVRAVMLPHAGWRYCGDVVGRTLAHVRVPKTVVIVGPKHTSHGALWSVSNADAWEIPGARVPVAEKLRARLLELVPNLVAESQAHAQEHSIEVIIPFLLAKNPSLQILPIVMGATAYSHTERMARALAVLAQELNEEILLVISSDMNHFAAEPENRRLDFLALDALTTGDASRLYDVVQEHQISMCGMIPAVTVLRALSFLKGLPQPKLVHYDNSATASGQFDRVVGYAGVLIP